MKLNKTLMALAVGLAVAPFAHGQANPVYLAGSTAFRAQVFQALTDLGLTPNTGDVNTANTFTFHGTVTPSANMASVLSANGYPLPSGFNGQSVTFYCSFDGSAQGVHDLTAETQNSFNPVGGGTQFTHGIDCAFSDVAQASTIFTSPGLREFVAPDAGTTPGTGVAVVPFLWAANAAASNAGVTYIKHDIIKYLFNSGSAPLAFWTGNNSDGFTLVAVTGRDNGSGSRIVPQDLEGWLPGTQISQYLIGASTSDPDGLATGLSWTTGGTLVGNPGTAIVSSSTSPLPSGGYSSGGKVCDALAYPAVAQDSGNGAGGDGGASTSTAAAVGCMSFSDAKNLPYPVQLAAAEAAPGWVHATPVAGEILTYEGINPVLSLPAAPGPLVYNINAVINGTYPVWVYEHLYENPDVTTGSYVDVDAGPGLTRALWYEIYVQGSLHSATGGGLVFPQTAIIESDMDVARNSDGGGLIPYYLP
jgi:hypothetical protein